MFEASRPGSSIIARRPTPTRWTSGYDFPAAARRARRRCETLPSRRPSGMEGFVFNHAPRTVPRHPRARGARPDVRFRMDQRNLCSRPLHAHDELLRRIRSWPRSGRPASEAERALLTPFPGAVRDDILEGRWRPPRRRRHAAATASRRAARSSCSAQAGWIELVDNALEKDGDPFDFEIMVADRTQERLALNYASSLRRIGVIARVRLVDEVQYQRRRQRFDFDMMLGTLDRLGLARQRAAHALGLGKRDARRLVQSRRRVLAGDRRADRGDAVAARAEDFVTAVRAYDRVLLSGFYIVPLFHASKQWIAHSTKLARPRNAAALLPLVWRDLGDLVEDGAMTPGPHARRRTPATAALAARSSADHVRLRRADLRRGAAAAGRVSPRATRSAARSLDHAELDRRVGRLPRRAARLRPSARRARSARRDAERADADRAHRHHRRRPRAGARAARPLARGAGRRRARPSPPPRSIAPASVGGESLEELLLGVAAAGALDPAHRLARPRDRSTAPSISAPRTRRRPRTPAAARADAGQESADRRAGPIRRAALRRAGRAARPQPRPRRRGAGQRRRAAGVAVLAGNDRRARRRPARLAALRRAAAFRRALRRRGLSRPSRRASARRGSSRRAPFSPISTPPAC